MTFRILSLDGGGIRGVISARILVEVERQLKQCKGLALHEYFDMIAGTSTGSILTAGIATKKSADKLIKLYQETGQIIFPPKETFFPEPVQKLLDIFGASKYSHAGLIEVLRKELGETKISQVQNPILLILAYDMRYRNTTFFTNLHPDIGARWYDDSPLWEICTSSSSAPTFFPPYELKPYNEEKFGKWSFPHIDGGVSANNPSLAAISHVMKISRANNVPQDIKQRYKLDNLKFEDISVLSIGTGRSGEPFEFEQLKNWKTLDWVQRVVDVFMEPTSEIATTICKQILGGFESKRYLRLEFDLNERFKAKDEKKETYKDTRLLVKAHERTNRFTGKRVSEAIDDARAEIINDLIETTTAFIEKGHTYYLRDNDQGPLVREAIGNFINAN